MNVRNALRTATDRNAYRPQQSARLRKRTQQLLRRFRNPLLYPANLREHFAATLYFSAVYRGLGVAAATLYSPFPALNILAEK